MVSITLMKRVFLGKGWLRKVAVNLCTTTLFALATAYAAQVKFFLPWTPVPITLQTFVVLSAGVLLGRWWGSFSQLLYVGTGTLGLPLFAGMAGGLPSLLGPRGGYLLGFILSSFLVGWVAGKAVWQRSYLTRFLLLTSISALSIYGLGCSWLAVWLWCINGSVPTVYQVLMMGLVPFIPGAILKIGLVSFFYSAGGVFSRIDSINR